MAPRQFALPRPVAPRAMTWHHQCSEDPGAEVDLPAVRRLPRCEISGSPTGKLVAVWCRTASGPVLSPGPLLSSASDAAGAVTGLPPDLPRLMAGD
jgi:hypothetical protein